MLFHVRCCLLLVVICLLSSGFAHEVRAQPDEKWKLLDVSAQLTIEGIGYGQGVFTHQGFIYLYGDAETGVIRQYRWNAQQPLQLQSTGVEIRLTRNGEDIAPHPTGLTHHPQFGTFLGDTVQQKGTIFWIDWERALQDCNLDHAVLNMLNDDLAQNGTRPEFVQINDRWLIATSDYGGTGNELRLYDPIRLKSAVRSSAPGVLVHRQSCGPWVQTVEWVPEFRSLALVQNQIEGLRYRLTFLSWENGLEASSGAPLDLQNPRDELEGWTYLGEGYCLYLSSSLKQNVSIGRIRTPLTP